jgi:hypothetical protein
MSDTPETDAFFAEWTRTDGVLARSRLHAEKLERERDEALHKLELYMAANSDVARIARERDEAREKLEDWENSAKHVRSEWPDEQHCSCVPILRKLLKDAERERDEAREALMKIEDLFIDGTDIYADIEKMGTIARAALEGAK